MYVYVSLCLRIREWIYIILKHHWHSYVIGELVFEYKVCIQVSTLRYYLFLSHLYHLYTTTYTTTYTTAYTTTYTTSYTITYSVSPTPLPTPPSTPPSTPLPTPPTAEARKYGEQLNMSNRHFIIKLFSIVIVYYTISNTYQV